MQSRNGGDQEIAGLMKRGREALQSLNGRKEINIYNIAVKSNPTSTHFWVSNRRTRPPLYVVLCYPLFPRLLSESPRGRLGRARLLHHNFHSTPPMCTETWGSTSPVCFLYCKSPAVCSHTSRTCHDAQCSISTASVNITQDCK